jgi:outer membrane protein, multidrug efflux system
MNKSIKYIVITAISILFLACKTPEIVGKTESKNIPEGFNKNRDSTNTGNLTWSKYFSDPYLTALIDTALQNNQELNIAMQEINISQNEVMARKGEYMPFVSLRGGAGVEKVGRYTQQGSSEATTDIKPGRETPEPLPDFMFGAFATWEADIWHKLRNAKKAASVRYLATMEGRNFMVTNMISEIAQSYYELLALDKQLEIIRQNIEIQSNALIIVKQQKEAARTTELAVKRFEAQVFNTRSLQFEVQQHIIEAENRINFLLGRYPQPIVRSTMDFEKMIPTPVNVGLPVQLLENRPDVRQAELELSAAKIDVEVAKANFYPSIGLSAGLGLQSFNPILLINPKSLLTNLAADMVKPWINKNGITANYYNANASQIQAVYKYERTVLNAFVEVANQLSNIENLQKSYDLKASEVQALNQSITISNNLFRSARADYMEVLLTQRDAIESRFDLVETKMKQMNASVNVYRALGGGWK